MNDLIFPKRPLLFVLVNSRTVENEKLVANRMGNNIISHETIRTYLMKMDDFKYTANRMFPALDQAAKDRRL